MHEALRKFLLKVSKTSGRGVYCFNSITHDIFPVSCERPRMYARMSSEKHGIRFFDIFSLYHTILKSECYKYMGSTRDA